MKITRREENGKTVLAVDGWLDTLSSAELMQAVEAVGDVESLVLDFDGVRYICSSGLRAVLYGYKKMLKLGGDFSVVGVGDEVMDVFRLAGLTDSLNIAARKRKECVDCECVE